MPPRSESPILTSGSERMAEGEEMTMSQFIRTSIPPPTARPLTAASMGFAPCRWEMPQKPEWGSMPCSSLDADIHSADMLAGGMCGG